MKHSNKLRTSALVLTIVFTCILAIAIIAIASLPSVDHGDVFHPNAWYALCLLGLPLLFLPYCLIFGHADAICISIQDSSEKKKSKIK